jgi:hypothetical protein
MAAFVSGASAALIIALLSAAVVLAGGEKIPYP